MKKLLLCIFPVFMICSLIAAPFKIPEITFLPPLTTTQPVTSITASGALLHGTVDDNGNTTTVVFEYGQSADLSDGVVIATDSGIDTVAGGAGITSFAANLNGLNASTRYYYRIRASNIEGATAGAIGFFTTLPPPPVILSFSPASGPAGTLVTINGSDLEDLSTIMIGGKTAIVVSSSGSKLVAMVMPGATTGNVSLTTPGGIATGAGGFTVAETLYPTSQQGSKLLTSDYGPTISARGTAVAISADGNTAIVGAPGDGGNNIGCVWVFVRKAGLWVQQGQKLVGTGYNTGTIGRGGSLQGAAVSISADGNTAMVGGNLDSFGTGAVWVFTRIDTTWSQQGQKLVASDDVGVARFGNAVSLSADGNTAIIGGWGDNNNNGAVWIYTRSNGVWVQNGSKFTGAASAGAAQIGYSVAMSADGTTAAAGGFRDNGGIGAVWIYVKNGGVWQQQGAKLVGTGMGPTGAPQQGISVAVSADGNTVATGGNFDSNPIGGAVWIYVRNSGVWSQQGTKLVGTNTLIDSQQGYSVALSADGNTLAEGGSEYKNISFGGIWIFTRTGSTWTQRGNKLVGNGTVNGDRGVNQGYAIALSADGGTVIEGGYRDNNDRGAAWLFASGLPADTTLAATDITATGATLHGTVKDNGTATSVTFEYGTAPDLSGASIAVLSSGISPVIAGTGSVSFSSILAGLSPATTYYFRINGLNNNGQTYGPVLSFTTTGQSAPAITSWSPSFGPVGTLVTVTGSNLHNPSVLNIGGTAAIVVSGSDTQLVAMVMPGTINGVVSVTTPGGTINSSENFVVTSTLHPDTQIGSKLAGTGNVSYSHQGVSVAISADGNTAAIGGNIDAGSARGAVWIFVRNNGLWLQQGSKLTASGYTGSYGPNLGVSVAISASGNTVIAGGEADNDGVGAVWVFTRNGSLWTQQGNKLVAKDYIGASHQGTSVSLSADGNTAIIGASADNYNNGAAWIFNRVNGVWSQNGRKLFGTGQGGEGRQGGSVAISADGKTAVVGGYRDNGGFGSIWIYTQNGGVWMQQGNKLTLTVLTTAAQLGQSVAVNADGTTIAAGGNFESPDGNGAVWIYVKNGSSWVQQGKISGTASYTYAFQGYAVALSADGNTLMEGGPNYLRPNNGGIWVFTRSAGSWTQRAGMLQGTGAVAGSVGSNQGWAVSLNATGEVGIEGGYTDNSHIGAAWIFGNNSAMAVTTNATGITASEAVLHGSIRNNNASTSVTIEYSTDANLAGATTAVLTMGISPVPAGSGSASFNSNVTGLIPSTTYYFRIKGVASGTTVNGAVLSFTTEADTLLAPLLAKSPAGSTLSDTINSVTDKTGKGEITFYPNPVTNKTGMLHFNQIPHGRYTLVLTDATGRIIFTREVLYNGFDVPVSLTGQPAGLYLLKISSPVYKKVFTLLVE